MDNKVKRHFDSIAWVYDVMESPMDLLSVSAWRRELVSGVKGRALEVGIGTGRNLAYYPPDTDLTGVDISPKMLERAKKKSEALGMTVTLLEMDIEHMSFPDEHFDYTISTFVFCTVPDPVEGLREVKRVLKKNGTALFLEHVRSENRFMGKLMDILNPVVRAVTATNINRKTADNIRTAGLQILSEANMGGSKIMKMIKAVKAGIDEDTINSVERR